GNPATVADVMIDLLKKKLPLPAGQRDMVVLLHELDVVYPDEGGRKERLRSALIEFGEADGFTAMSKTVGLPAAIAAKLVLTDQLPLTGCQLPTHPVIYEPVLSELESLGIRFNEEIVPVPE
ncbi:MAG: saccharopine dehydrogenase, partial [Calditrichaeota bacterium]|nr:saccharopine dehydrogenase [Calditrichota bacterium]